MTSHFDVSKPLNHFSQSEVAYHCRIALSLSFEHPHYFLARHNYFYISDGYSENKETGSLSRITILTDDTGYLYVLLDSDLVALIFNLKKL